MVQKIFTNLEVVSAEAVEKSVAQELDLEDKDLEELLHESEDNTDNTKNMSSTG